MKFRASVLLIIYGHAFLTLKLNILWGYNNDCCFSAYIIFRLSRNQVWRIDDVTFCFLHNHNVRFIYIERDTDSYAEVYRFAMTNELLLTFVIFMPR